MQLLKHAVYVIFIQMVKSTKNHMHARFFNCFSEIIENPSDPHRRKWKLKDEVQISTIFTNNHNSLFNTEVRPRCKAIENMIF